MCIICVECVWSVCVPVLLPFYPMFLYFTVTTNNSIFYCSILTLPLFTYPVGFTKFNYPIIPISFKNELKSNLVFSFSYVYSGLLSRRAQDRSSIFPYGSFDSFVLLNFNDFSKISVYLADLILDSQSSN